jgi:hypothetical protein
MFFLADTSGTFQRWLHDLIPFDALVALVNDVTIDFVLVACLILAAGLISRLQGEHDPVRPYVMAMVLFACIAMGRTFLDRGEMLVYALVQQIVQRVPSLSWILVNNPTDITFMMNFDAPYKAIAQYVKGSFQHEDTHWWEVLKQGEYFARSAMVFVAGMAAAVTVFIMEAMLVLQKLILVSSRLFLPLAIASLSLPAASGAGVKFIKAIIGTTAMPLAWAIGHLGTMAVLSHLQTPTWDASLGEVFREVAILAGICIWMFVVTTAGPSALSALVIAGNNPGASVLGKAGGEVANLASNVVKDSAVAGGAMAGAAMGGAAGVAAGAKAGSILGGFAAQPIATASQGIEDSTGTHAPHKPSFSAHVADGANGLLSKP